MTDIRIALDSNVLDYSEGRGDAKRCHFARDLAADQHCRLSFSEGLQRGFTTDMVRAQ